MERMMKKLVYLSLFAGLLFITPSSHAIIYQISRWWHPELQQEVNLLKDVHVDTGDYRMTSDQRLDIIERENISFKIIEDPSEHYKFVQDPAIRAQLKKGLTQELKSADVYKIISPHDRLATLRQYFTPYEEVFAASPLTGLHLFNNTYNAEFRYTGNYKADDLIKEISAYKDGPILNSYYLRIIKKIESIKKERDLGNIVSQERMKEALFDVLETRILHALYNNPNQNIIDIIAGGEHINRIEPIMQQLGYRKITSTRSHHNFEDHLDVNQKHTVFAVDIKKTLAEPLAQKLQKPIKAKL